MRSSNSSLSSLRVGSALAMKSRIICLEYFMTAGFSCGSLEISSFSSGTTTFLTTGAGAGTSACLTGATTGAETCWTGCLTAASPWARAFASSASFSFFFYKVLILSLRESLLVLESAAKLGAPPLLVFGAGMVFKLLALNWFPCGVNPPIWFMLFMVLGM